ncbi:uncharacterized protein isoform X2 [Takifugu rubripes]|uniref:uncharacterized protein isoform X2 n=1 Tax=Takifugu rubripes TaxID=31033 RepID=UPI001145AD77|nr:uncharacterized protein LOC115250776 isoform X2 [Takifugu rubripes]
METKGRFPPPKSGWGHIVESVRAGGAHREPQTGSCSRGDAWQPSTAPSGGTALRSSSSIMLNIRLLQHVRNPLRPPTRILVCSKVALCIMPVTQIAIGAVHLDDCPREPQIPIYLIVSGVFSLALALLSCLPCSRQVNDEPTNPLSRVCTAWNSLTTFFLFCWFVVGYVWIYSIYEPNYNKTATAVDPYCDRTLYLFALGTTALVFILLGLVCVVGCCVLVCLWLLV